MTSWGNYVWPIRSNINDIDFSCCVVTKVDFSEFFFNDCFFKHTTFIDCDFRGCTFLRCIFNTSTFRECKFDNSVNINCSVIIDTSINGSNADGLNFCCSFFKDLRINHKMHRPYLQCPEIGSFIGYKKCMDEETEETRIVTLRIPEEARRISSYGSKCRAEFAEVLAIEDLDGNPYKEAVSIFKYAFPDGGCTYTVGETVWANDFDDNWSTPCSNGIHFFISKQEVIDYQI